MTATNETQEPRFTDPPKKAVKPKPEKRARQNHLARYTELKGKVDMALKLLGKAKNCGDGTGGNLLLVELALELLQE